MVTISFAITVKDELRELQNLILVLTPHIRENDELIILVDDKGSEEVKNYLSNLDFVEPVQWKYFEETFNGNFSEWKNKQKELCSKEYVFSIDADEIPNETLLENIHSILETNPKLEALWVPRENYVIGITEEHIKVWGWRVEKLEKNIIEKTFNLDNPDDLKEYNFLKNMNLIIGEK